jgi:hypothetical protein
MDTIWPLWPFLVPLSPSGPNSSTATGTFWSVLVPCDPFLNLVHGPWEHIQPCIYIWSQGQFWYKVISTGGFWSVLILSGPMWSLILWFLKVPFGRFWSLLVPYGPLWSHLVPSPEKEKLLRLFEYFHCAMVDLLTRTKWGLANTTYYYVLAGQGNLTPLPFRPTHISFWMDHFEQLAMKLLEYNIRQLSYIP